MSASQSVEQTDGEYAYAVGRAAGIFLRLQHYVNDSYGSATGLLTYSRYDKRVLDAILPRIDRSVALIIGKKNQANMAKAERAYKSICALLKTGEITHPERDYSYFFHKGVLYEMCEEEK